MNRCVAAKVIPGFLVVILVLAGCCNENWKGVGTVSGTLTINGSWPGDINALTVQSVDNCENKMVHWNVLEGLELTAVIDALATYGTFTTELEEQEVIAGKILTRFMVRPSTSFRYSYETRMSVEYKLKKNGSKTLALTYTFPDAGTR